MHTLFSEAAKASQTLWDILNVLEAGKIADRTLAKSILPISIQTFGFMQTL